MHKNLISVFVIFFIIITQTQADTFNHTGAINKNIFLQPMNSLSVDQKLDFKIGQGFFKRLWVTAPSSTKAADGLGPLFNARACMTCHPRNGRGIPIDSKDSNSVSLFMRIDIPAQTKQQASLLKQHKINNIADPVYGLQLQNFSIAGVKSEYKLQVEYSNVPVKLNDNTLINLQQPNYKISNLGYGPLHKQARLSPRMAPQMIGLGLLESISEQDILALADENDSNHDGISGRANRVFSRTHGKVMLGRFGYKAGNATLNDQSQAAFFYDIGLSTPLYPNGSGECSQTQKRCVQAPDGNDPQYNHLEVPQQITDLVDLYVKHIAVPKPRNTENSDVIAGKKLFNATGCNQCHVANFKTPKNSNVNKSLQNKMINPYTDLLLHDMGEGLADNRPEGVATGREWRTTPLWGIGLSSVVNDHAYFLHDGRAQTILEAILWHGGEAQRHRDKVISMSKKERQQLIKFLESI